MHCRARMVKKTIPQSTPLTAPFTQGSLSLRQTREAKRKDDISQYLCNGTMWASSPTMSRAVKGNTVDCNASRANIVRPYGGCAVTYRCADDMPLRGLWEKLQRITTKSKYVISIARFFDCAQNDNKEQALRCQCGRGVGDVAPYGGSRGERKHG